MLFILSHFLRHNSSALFLFTSFALGPGKNAFEKKANSKLAWNTLQCNDIQAYLKSLFSQAHFCPDERAFSLYDVKSKRALPIMTQKVRENKESKSAFPLSKNPMMRDIWYINTRRAEWWSTAATLPVCCQFAAIFYWNRLYWYLVCIEKF